MRGNGTDDSQIRRYLLGQISEPEKSTLEEEYFLNAGVLMQMEIAEEELIDDYLAEQLSQEERRRFEQFFLTLEDRKEKLLFAETLKEHLNKAGFRGKMAERRKISSTSLKMRLGLGAIAASLFLNVGLGWLLTREARKVERLQADQSAWGDQQNDLNARLAEADNRNAELSERLTLGEQSRTALEDRLQRLETRLSALQTIPRRVFSVFLQSGALRSAGATPRVNLPADTLILELQLELNEDAEGYQSYQIELSRVDGGSLLVQMGLHTRREAERALIHLTLPSNQLPSGDYLIRLAGSAQDGSLEELDQYGFRMNRIR